MKKPSRYWRRREWAEMALRTARQERTLAENALSRARRRFDRAVENYVAAVERARSFGLDA